LGYGYSAFARVGDAHARARCLAGVAVGHAVAAAHRSILRRAGLRLHLACAARGCDQQRNRGGGARSGHRGIHTATTAADRKHAVLAHLASRTVETGHGTLASVGNADSRGIRHAGIAVGHAVAAAHRGGNVAAGIGHVRAHARVLRRHRCAPTVVTIAIRVFAELSGRALGSATGGSNGAFTSVADVDARGLRPALVAIGLPIATTHWNVRRITGDAGFDAGPSAATHPRWRLAHAVHAALGIGHAVRRLSAGNLGARHCSLDAGAGVAAVDGIEAVTVLVEDATVGAGSGNAADRGAHQLPVDAAAGVAVVRRCNAGFTVIVLGAIDHTAVAAAALGAAAIGATAIATAPIA